MIHGQQLTVLAAEPLSSSTSMSSASFGNNNNNDRNEQGHQIQQDSVYSHSLVSIPLGPNSSLQLSPQDRMNVFTNASYSLNVEGEIWQQHGTLSYNGLTKSDPFIKILRNFTIHLLKEGEMKSFIRTDQRSKDNDATGENENDTEKKSDSISPFSKPSHLTGGTPKDIPILNTEQDSADAKNKTPSVRTGDLVDEDILIVSKISRSNSENNENQYSANVHSNNQTENSTAAGISILPAIEAVYLARRDKSFYYKYVEEVLLSILPNKRNQSMLHARYFKFVHPFIPILDQNSILEEVSSTLEKFPCFDNEYYNQIKIQNDIDVQIMGIHLLIMRLGYLSLVHNDYIYNNYTEDEQSIIDDMKRIDSQSFINAINLCIGNSLVQARSSFKLIQLLTMLYFYRRVVPDDCHGISGADAHNLFGIIIKHAITTGLNRDPTCYITHSSITENVSLIQTWRFLWDYLCNADAISSIHTGTTLNLMCLEISDVQSPIWPDDKTGLMNQHVEKSAMIAKGYRNIVNKFSNVSQKPRIVDILMETNQLEKIFFEYFGKDFFKDVICTPAKVPETADGFNPGSKEHQEMWVKVAKYCQFVQLRTNLSGMYYMIALHYENGYNESKTPSMNAGIELFKIYIKSVVQLVYIMSYVLDNSVEIFGKNFDYILTSENERYMTKALSFLTSFFFRLLHEKKELQFRAFKDPSVKPRIDVIDKLVTLVLLESELFIGNFRKLSRTYLNSYRIYTITYIILKQCVTNPDAFFEKSLHDHRFFHHGTNMIEFFTVAELEHLCRLCGEFKSAKDEQQRQKQQRRSELLRQSMKSSSVPVVDEQMGVATGPGQENMNTVSGNLSSDNIGDGTMNDVGPLWDTEEDQIFSNLNNLNNLNDDEFAMFDSNAELLKLVEIYGDIGLEL